MAVILYDTKPPGDRDYLAPTIFLKAGAGLPRWNYYNSFDAARRKYRGETPAPAGSIEFTGGGTQTFGINSDFYTFRSGNWYNTSYASLRSGFPGMIARFYTTWGAGPFYAVINPAYFGLSATSVAAAPPDKLRELDSFYRSAQLLKFQYNELVGFLNSMSKRQLSAPEQQIFNEGLLRLQSLNNDIQSLRGIELQFTTDGAVGIPIIPIIIAIIVLAGAAAWTVADIAAEKEKTNRIIQAHNMQQWLISKKTQVAAMVQAGELSAADGAAIVKTIDSAQKSAENVANQAAKQSGGLLGDVKSIVMWGVIGLVVFKGMDLLKPNRA